MLFCKAFTHHEPNTRSILDIECDKLVSEYDEYCKSLDGSAIVPILIRVCKALEYVLY